MCEIKATPRNVLCGVAVCARSKPRNVVCRVAVSARLKPRNVLCGVAVCARSSHVTFCVEWLCVRGQSHVTLLGCSEAAGNAY